MIRNIKKEWSFYIHSYHFREITFISNSNFPIKQVIRRIHTIWIAFLSYLTLPRSKIRGLNDEYETVALLSRGSCEPPACIRKYPTIFQRLPFPDHIRARARYPPFPLRAFTARHSILHLMVHPSFANRHLDISARRCPMLANTRIWLSFYVSYHSFYLYLIVKIYIK